MKKQNSCIYCGEFNKLTKEHVYGKWLKNLGLPTYNTNEHIVQFFDFSKSKSKSSKVMRGDLNQGGSPVSHNLKVVCQSCNNGWMSKVQNDVKPILLEFIKGNWLNLNLSEMQKIANYAVMSTMTLEYADINTIAATAEERLLFKQSGKPPKNWHIYIGKRVNNCQTGSFWHKAGLILFANENTDLKKTNTQTTIILLGYLLVYVISAPEWLLPSSLNYSMELNILKIWPNNHEFKLEPKSLNNFEIRELNFPFWSRFNVDPYPPTNWIN